MGNQGDIQEDSTHIMIQIAVKVLVLISSHLLIMTLTHAIGIKIS